MKSALLAAAAAIALAVSLAACVETQSAWEARNAEQIKHLREIVIAAGGYDVGADSAIALSRSIGFQAAARPWQGLLHIKHLEAESDKLRRQVAARSLRCTLAEDLKIGMRYTEVRKICGVPDRTNTTTTAGHEHDQDVYEGLGNAANYLYFTDGVLTSVQVSY